jgi:hypothetical protein
LYPSASHDMTASQDIMKTVFDLLGVRQTPGQAKSN